MKSRVLPILNAIGCLILTGLVVSQWRLEREHLGDIKNLQSELAGSREDLIAGIQRSATLERDIAALKESIEATQQAAEAAAHSLAEQSSQAEDLQTELATTREQAATQIKAWEDAIAARDAKLEELNAALTATRARLDEAVTKLKAAGAR
ncbi:MAG: hypothetical protein WEB53_11665 [Akkermansiaceae bacterium]